MAGSFESTAPNNGATATGLGNGIFATSLTQWMASVDIGSHPGGYQIAGTGKFTGGSGSDILWTNTSGGSMQTEIRQLGPNGQWAQSVSPGTHPSGYQVAGVGDWSGDGTDGLLWFNSTTGDTDEWQLSNGKWAGSVDLGSHPGSYQISGVGDFFDNGNDDVLWTGLNSNGSVSTDIWELNSNGKWMASVSPGVHPAGYQVAGIGDFNHDGTSDILWYDASTNDVDLWELSKRSMGRQRRYRNPSGGLDDRRRRRFQPRGHKRHRLVQCNDQRCRYLGNFQRPLGSERRSRLSPRRLDDCRRRRFQW